MITRSAAAERQALTEEATKTSVILPFLQALGFDVFSLDEVIPEFIADVGVKKGEKVDFVIRIDGRIAMLIEVKPITAKLGDVQFNQLFRYFTVTDARLAILTNGREVWFFSDTDEPNKMDRKPFFTFDLQKHDKAQVLELARFRKGSFAIDSIIEAASNLKYTSAAANYLKKQLEDPDDDFVRQIGRQIYDGSITRAVAEQLRPAIQAALDALIRDRIEDKLSITLRPERTPVAAPADEVEESPGIDVVTTEEELEAFRIVRAIGARVAPVDQITLRDAKSYCAILWGDNNRRPICRFYFNSATTKTLGLFDADKVESKIRVGSVTDLYAHADAIEAVIRSYQ